MGLLSKGISFPVSIVVAMVLTPTDYGIIGFAGLFMTYASFATTGATSTAFREMPGYIQKGRLDRAKNVQNVSMTIETILLFLATLVLVGIALQQKDPVVKWVMILTIAGGVLGKIRGFLEMINFTYREFSLSAKGRVVQVVSYPVLTLSLLFWAKIYTIPIVGILGAVMVTLYFLKKKRYGLRFSFDFGEGLRLVKIGLVLHAGTILYTLFSQTLDKTLIAAYLSKEQLGLYVFSYTFTALFLEIFRDYARVLKPTIWAHASNAPSVREGFQETKRMAIYFALVSAFLVGFLQLGFYVLVNYVTVKFIAAQWVFSIIVLYIFWEAIEKFPEMILCSAMVNRQNTATYIWGTCLAMNLCLDILAIKSGYGICGVAAATTVSQVISTIWMYYTCRDNLFSKRREFRKFLMRLLIPFLIPTAATVLHWIFLKKTNLMLLVPFSIAGQVIIWTAFVRLFYSDYFNGKMMFDLFNDIRGYLAVTLKLRKASA